VESGHSPRAKEQIIPASLQAMPYTRRQAHVSGAVILCLCLASAILALAGCGIGPGSVPVQVRLTISRDFGSSPIEQRTVGQVPGAQTMMGLLRSNARVTTGPGGNIVRSIDGVSASPPSRWFYYVNGVQVFHSPRTVKVHPGDHIWWDLHDPTTAREAPVVIGSFPEPFLNGLGGQRLPVRVECASVQSNPCRTVTARLRSLGVPAAIAGIGVTEGLDTLRVLVGTWRALRGDPGSQILGEGSQASGVYAEFATDGRRLTLFDEAMRPVRTLESDAGLIAATRFSNERPEWLITGTDGSGVELAAQAFSQTKLERHFALAVSAIAPIPVPIRSR
jgi:Domain of unknown function (DUF4430)